MNSNQLTFVFDIDGTICPIKKNDERYEELVPHTHIVDKMRHYKKQGAKIILFTSRNMNSYDGNIGKININTAPVLMEWIKKWDIPCDELVLGKPWPGHNGYYIDDRTLRPKEFLDCSLDEMTLLCGKDRLNG